VSLRMLVIGAGATGGHFGALAASGGADVTFVQRGPHGAAMRDRGVMVRGPGLQLAARPRVVARPEDVRGDRFDVVLVAVKSADLRSVLPAAADCCSPGGAVVIGQNGVDADSVAAQTVPAAQLVGAVLFISAWVSEPGIVQVNGKGQMILGAMSPQADPVARRLAAELAACGLPAAYTAQLASARWAKLVFNNAWNVLTCLTGLTVGAVARTPELRELAARAMTEVVGVARASGVELCDAMVDVCLRQGDEVGETRTSMLQDRLARRPLEVEALCGAIVKRGRRLGVATPVNDLLYALMLGVDQARVEPGHGRRGRGVASRYDEDTPRPATGRNPSGP
jgi:2-dehydropantoate 2-reductase